MIDVYLTHKEKNKKYSDCILTVNGGNFCLASAQAAIYFLTGEKQRNVNIFWGEYVSREKMYKGESPNCKHFTITDKECGVYHDYSIIDDYFWMRGESAYDYLKEFYQEDSEFLESLESYIVKYGKRSFVFGS